MDLDDKKKLEQQSLNDLISDSVIVNGSSQANLLESNLSYPTTNLMSQTRFSFQFLSCSTLRGLIIKNLIKLTRNPSVLVMNVIFPILWVIAVYLGLRKDPYDIPFGIVNDELKIMQENCSVYDQGDWYPNSIPQMY